MHLPERLLGSSCIFLLGLLFTTGINAQQDPATKKLVEEAALLRESKNSPDPDLQKATKEARDRREGLTNAIRDWVELRLPKSKDALDADYSLLQDSMKAELIRAGVFEPSGGLDEYGYIGRLELSRPAEFPDALTVVAGVTVPCGSADSVYVYDYSGGQPRRIFESQGANERGDTVSGVYFLAQDADGGHLILTLRHAVQCGSSWNELSYDLFRLSAGARAGVPVFSGKHGIWLAGEHPFDVEFKPDEFLIEFRDRSIDSGFRNRTHVLHYSIGPSAVERMDPVALQPQDFVDEWITRPWAEMESRSSGADRDTLQKWHDSFSGGVVTGHFDVVQRCTEKPDDWQVATTLDWIAGKKLPEPRTLYFLVHDLGDYKFEMAAVSDERQEGCPGESRPNSDSPSLFETNHEKSEEPPAVPN